MSERMLGRECCSTYGSRAFVSTFQHFEKGCLQKCKTASRCFSAHRKMPSSVDRGTGWLNMNEDVAEVLVLHADTHRKWCCLFFLWQTGCELVGLCSRCGTQMGSWCLSSVSACVGGTHNQWLSTSGCLDENCCCRFVTFYFSLRPVVPPSFWRISTKRIIRPAFVTNLSASESWCRGPRCQTQTVWECFWRCGSEPIC